MTAAVHQLVPTYEAGAVGSHVAEVRRTLRRAGFESEVFTDHLRRGAPGPAHPTDAYGERVPARAGDVLLYHLAIGSTMADRLRARHERLVVDYHNITPAQFFSDWEPMLAYDLAWGRLQLAELAARAELGIADSAYNAGELRAAGYRRAEVAPILLDLDAFQGEVDERTLDRLGGPGGRPGGRGTAWLFVGRVAPNKAQHDLVRAFAVHRRLYDPCARLRLVGGSSSAAYLGALRGAVDELDLGGAVDLAGSVTAAELAAHYRAADVFVCLSEHEGFCVPLLEAWWHGVPVVAFAAAAVPETLGDAGLLLADKAPDRVAAAVHRVATDPGVRTALVEAGRRRLRSHFSLEVTRARLLDALAPVLGDGR